MILFIMKLFSRIHYFKITMHFIISQKVLIYLNINFFYAYIAIILSLPFLISSLLFSAANPSTILLFCYSSVLYATAETSILLPQLILTILTFEVTCIIPFGFYLHFCFITPITLDIIIDTRYSVFSAIYALHNYMLTIVTTSLYINRNV